MFEQATRQRRQIARAPKSIAARPMSVRPPPFGLAPSAPAGSDLHDGDGRA